MSRRLRRKSRTGLLSKSTEMDSIVSKVQVELINLAADYADAEHENVTLSLISDFKRALFAILDENIRIKDLEQSEELQDEMEELFEDEYPTKQAWPYLNQLEKQDRCFAALGCRFKHGAALYKSPLCEEHFVCKNHQAAPCLAKHQHIPGQERRANDKKPELANKVPDAGKLGSSRSIRQIYVAHQEAHKYKERPVAPDTVQEEIQTSGDREVKKVQFVKSEVKDDPDSGEDDFSNYSSSSSSDENEWDDNTLNRTSWSSKAQE